MNNNITWEQIFRNCWLFLFLCIPLFVTWQIWDRTKPFAHGHQYECDVQGSVQDGVQALNCSDKEGNYKTFTVSE